MVRMALVPHMGLIDPHVLNDIIARRNFGTNEQCLTKKSAWASVIGHCVSPTASDTLVFGTTQMSDQYSVTGTGFARLYSFYY